MSSQDWITASISLTNLFELSTSRLLVHSLNSMLIHIDRIANPKTNADIIDVDIWWDVDETTFCRLICRLAWRLLGRLLGRLSWRLLSVTIVGMGLGWGIIVAGWWTIIIGWGMAAIAAVVIGWGAVVVALCYLCWNWRCEDWSGEEGEEKHQGLRAELHLDGCCDNADFCLETDGKLVDLKIVMTGDEWIRERDLRWEDCRWVDGWWGKREINVWEESGICTKLLHRKDG